MSEANTTRSKSSRQLLLYYLLRIAIGANLWFYFCEVVIKLLYGLLYPEEPITWQSVLLGTSKNWIFFVNVRVLMLVVGVIGAIVAWKIELFRQKKLAKK